MALDKRLLEILCCPVTRQPVLPASAAQLDAIKRAHAAGALRTVEGVVLESAPEAALVTRDHKRAYAVVDGIPVMLADQAIDLAALEDLPA